MIGDRREEPGVEELLGDYREQLLTTEEGVAEGVVKDAMDKLLASLPSFANKRKWRDDFEDHKLLEILNTEGVEKQEAALMAATFEPGEPHEKMEAAADWNQADLPEREWIIPQWLPAGRIGILTGPGGQGKSRLAFQLAASMAAGEEDWLPHGGPELVSDKAAGVVVATWEDETVELARRFQRRNDYETIKDKIGDRLRALAVGGNGPLWKPSKDHILTTGKLSTAGVWLRAYCERHRVKLLVIDPLAAAYSCSENDRGLVRQFMADWDTWAQRAKCAVLLIAHPPKNPAKYSGSTDWHSASRFVWSLGIDEKSESKENVTPTLDCLKSNYGSLPNKLLLHGWPNWSVAQGDHGAVENWRDGVD